MEGIARMQCRHRRKAHIRARIKRVLCVIGILLLITLLYGLANPKMEPSGTYTYFVKSNDTIWDIAKSNVSEDMDVRDYINLIYELNEDLTPDIKCGQAILLPVFDNKESNMVQAATLKAQYTSLGVPNINSSCKRWMDYRKTTNKKSPQYAFISKYGWVDSEGFMRCSGERDLGINDDYYLIALGSYYGTTIGTKYRITTDTGKVFYGALAERKADIHTNPTHQYTNQKNPDIVEFLIDKNKLNKDVRRAGSANVYMPLNGSISKIERIDFIEG